MDASRGGMAFETGAMPVAELSRDFEDAPQRGVAARVPERKIQLAPQGREVPYGDARSIAHRSRKKLVVDRRATELAQAEPAIDQAAAQIAVSSR